MVIATRFWGYPKIPRRVRKEKSSPELEKSGFPPSVRRGAPGQRPHCRGRAARRGARVGGLCPPYLCRSRSSLRAARSPSVPPGPPRDPTRSTPACCASGLPRPTCPGSALRDIGPVRRVGPGCRAEPDSRRAFPRGGQGPGFRLRPSEDPASKAGVSAGPTLSPQSLTRASRVMLRGARNGKG